MQSGAFGSSAVKKGSPEFKRVQDALRSSEAEFRTLVETMPQIVWVTRPDGWHIDFNQPWLDYTGLTLEESLGFGWNPPFHPEDRARAAEMWLQATSSGEPYEILEFEIGAKVVTNFMVCTLYLKRTMRTDHEVGRNQK